MKPVSFLSGLLGSFVAWSLFAGALARPLPLAAAPFIFWDSFPTEAFTAT